MRRLLYVDIGLEILNTAPTALSEINLLLPFRAGEGRWPDRTPVVEDLYDSMSGRDECELIFGGPVEYGRQGDWIVLQVNVYPQSPDLMLGRILHAQVREENGRRDDMSLYRVPLANAIASGDRRYLRMRWRVLKPGSMWRSSYLRSGIRLDFRICGDRESRHAGQEGAVRDRIVNLTRVDFSAMVSPRLDETSSSPDFKKRTLEISAWRHYLRGSPFLSFSKGLVAYSCKYLANSSGNPTIRHSSVDNPFQIHLSLSQTVNRTRTAKIGYTALGLLLALSLVGVIAYADRLLEH